jgi:hypothetical protein
MRLAIRPMHDSESDFVLDTWTRSIDARLTADGRGRERVSSGKFWTVNRRRGAWLRVGTDMLADWAWYAMHRAWVKSLWPELDVIVATPADSDEALGWCAMTPPGDHPLVIHYVYVVGPPCNREVTEARGKGVGRRLLQAAAQLADTRAPRFSMMRGKQSEYDAGYLDAPLATIVDEAWRAKHNANSAAQTRSGDAVH